MLEEAARMSGWARQRRGACTPVDGGGEGRRPPQAAWGATQPAAVVVPRLLVYPSDSGQSGTD